MSNKMIQNVAKEIARLVKSELDKLNYQLFDNGIQEWMTTKEAAVYLRITEGNLRTKVSRGQIQVHGRLGNSWRFKKDELDKLLNDPQQGEFK